MDVALALNELSDRWRRHHEHGGSDVYLQCANELSSIVRLPHDVPHTHIFGDANDGSSCYLCGKPNSHKLG